MVQYGSHNMRGIRRRFCGLTLHSSLVLLAIASRLHFFVSLIRSIRCGMPDCSLCGRHLSTTRLDVRCLITLIQFSRYGQHVRGTCLPGVLHAISSREPIPGRSSRAKRWYCRMPCHPPHVFSYISHILCIYFSYMYGGAGSRLTVIL